MVHFRASSSNGPVAQPLKGSCLWRLSRRNVILNAGHHRQDGPPKNEKPLGLYCYRRSRPSIAARSTHSKLSDTPVNETCRLITGHPSVRICSYQHMIRIGVNMDWEQWGKVRETTFRELTPTSRVRTNTSKIPHMISTHAITLYKM